jgi:signal transduction histidine kinase
MDSVYCLDQASCSLLTPVDQLIGFLVKIDSRLAKIKKEVFLETLIEMATDEPMLLQLHNNFDDHCAAADDEDELTSAQARVKENFKKLAEQREAERKPINGIFYDVRIKTHFFGGQRQVVLVFTNVSAEKELQRELAMKELTKVMFTSINHELRTPCNAITNGLQLMRPFLNRASLKYYDICESSLKFLMSLVNDTLDFAQLQAGKFKMNFEFIDLRATIDEVV